MRLLIINGRLHRFLNFILQRNLTALQQLPRKRNVIKMFLSANYFPYYSLKFQLDRIDDYISKFYLKYFAFSSYLLDKIANGFGIN